MDPAKDPYGRDADPPPGDSWRALLGKEQLTVVLISLYVIENSGVRLLSSMLRNQGVKVHEIYFRDWVNNRIEPPSAREVQLLLDELADIRPDMVGISVRASAFHRIATHITEEIRRRFGVPVLWGGFHTTSCTEDAAKVADMVCVGEAETTVPALISRLRAGEDPCDLPGLWINTGKGIARNATATLIQDLDSLPFADYHSPEKTLIDGKILKRGDPYASEPIYLVMASRGCPFPSCTFCSNSVMDEIYPGQRYFRLRSVGHVLAEVDYAKQTFSALRRIRFDDEEFPIKRSWFDEFCRRWPEEGGMPFEVHMDPRVVTAERVERLRDVGMDTVFMGIQSTAKVNREFYCRDVSDEQVLKAANILHDSGVRVGYQVILDDPVSTTQDKRELIDLLLELPRPYEMVLFSLAIYPGSAIARRLLKDGVIQPDEVEGRATKVFRQFRVDLSYDRPPEDRFWAALVVLVSKDFVPKEVIRKMADSESLRRHPEPVVSLAFGANVAKLGFMGFDLLRRKELTWSVVRRWLSLKALVTY